MIKVSHWLFAILFFGAVALVEAQQPAKIPRIGFLQRRVAPTPTNPDPLGEAFLQGLRELGYIAIPPNVLVRADRVIR